MLRQILTQHGTRAIGNTLSRMIRIIRTSGTEQNTIMNAGSPGASTWMDRLRRRRGPMPARVHMMMRGAYATINKMCSKLLSNSSRRMCQIMTDLSMCYTNCIHFVRISCLVHRDGDDNCTHKDLLEGDLGYETPCFGCDRMSRTTHLSKKNFP